MKHTLQTVVSLLEEFPRTMSRLGDSPDTAEKIKPIKSIKLPKKSFPLTNG